MPIFTIRQFPDPVLRKVSSPIGQMNRALERFIERLIETMKRQPGGVGIAAPQVGVLKQIAIVDVSPKVVGATLKILINPEILSASEAVIRRAGCMSLPD